MSYAPVKLLQRNPPPPPPSSLSQDLYAVILPNKCKACKEKEEKDDDEKLEGGLKERSVKSGGTGSRGGARELRHTFPRKLTN